MEFTGMTVTFPSGKTGVITRKGSKDIFIKNEDGREFRYEYPEDFKSGYLKPSTELEKLIKTDIKVSLINDLLDSTPINNVKDYRSDAETVNELVSGTVFGTNSKTIYNQLCKNPAFKLDPSYSKDFGHQGANMWAPNVIPGYDLWFITYSTNEGTSEYTNTWENSLSDDLSVIDEICNDSNLMSEKMIEESGRKRLVFINVKGKYIFLGLYDKAEVIETGSQIIRKYKLISDTFKL